jgi:hypothetical protein
MNSRILDRKILSDCFSHDVDMGELRIPDPRSIFSFDPHADSCEEFKQLAHEVLEKIGGIQ